jgi:hypothetical protein
VNLRDMLLCPTQRPSFTRLRHTENSIRDSPLLIEKFTLYT